jgi:hypothetical protein
MPKYTSKSESYKIIKEVYQLSDIQMIMIIPPTTKTPIKHALVVVEPRIQVP